MTTESISFLLGFLTDKSEKKLNEVLSKQENSIIQEDNIIQEDRTIKIREYVQKTRLSTLRRKGNYFK